MRFPIRLLPALLAAGLGTACRDADPGRSQLVVFAAASLRDFAGDLGAELERRQSAEVVFNFAGSNTLAQQILAAPGADVFLSADERWVDVLDAAERTVPGSRRVFLSNRLVLIARRDAGLEIDDPRDLAGAEFRFLAVADPEAVPAGRYARAALEQAGGDLWNALAGRLAPALDVRAALALVESDPEILGIVYRTDAATSEEVRALYAFPAVEDAPVRYCAARVADAPSPELADRFLDLLMSPTAREIAARHGFSAPEE